MPLDAEQIEKLLAPKLRGSTKSKKQENGQEPLWKARQQAGPIRWYDTEFSCMSGYKGHRCGSPTYIKFQGIPYCSIHIINLANEMLVAKGVLS